MIMFIPIRGSSGLWPFCLWLFQFVAVPVGDRFGLWLLLFVAVSICGCFGLWLFQFVAVSVCGRLGFSRFGLWPL